MSVHLRSWVILAFLFAVISGLPAQRSAGNPFEHYLTTIEEIPLPGRGITNAILRDTRGFLWFGTTKGLCKYDGYTARAFLGESPFVSDVTAMLRLNRDSLMLGTAGGLWMFDLALERYAPVGGANALSTLKIIAMARDSGGTVWAGTASNGLLSYDPATHALRRYGRDDGLSDEQITALTVDHAGSLWIGTVSGGVNVLDDPASAPRRFRQPADEPELSSAHISVLHEKADRGLWIGTIKGLYLLDASRSRVMSQALPSPLEHTVWSIVEDGLGKQWMAVSDLGLLIARGGELVRFPPAVDQTKTLSAIRVLYPDPAESKGGRLLLWIGTRLGVVKLHLAPNPFSNHHRGEDSLQIDRGATLSLCLDRNDVLWLGLWGGGLEGLRRSEGTYRRIAHFKSDAAHRPSLPGNDVNALLADRKDNLWIGTSAGLAMLDPGRTRMSVWKHLGGDTSSLPGNEVSALYEDRNGGLWICSDGGLSHLISGDGSRFENYFHDRSDAHPVGGNLVSYLREDHLSRLWVATFGRGLNRLEPDGSFTRYLDPEDSSGTGENSIFLFAEDHQGLFWLSTQAGLVSFDPHTSRYHTYGIEPLRETHIFGIVPDRNGDLWLSTAMGLSRYNPRDSSFVTFGKKDGLTFAELFSDFCRDRRGRLLIGGLDGFTEFAPEDVVSSSRTPSIVLTSVAVFGDELSPAALLGGHLLLPYDRNYVSFSFAALDYADPSRNRFAYRMAGVDSAWVEAGERNFAAYPNLDPGTYLFQVKGSNSENVWNETGVSLSLLITPPYWQTWWFRAIAAVLAAGAVYTAYRYRLRKLLEVERLRLRIADDLHDDIGSNLSSIAMITMSVQRDPQMLPATKRKLADIYDTAVATSQVMRDIVWFIKPKNDSLEDLLLRMKDTASAILGDIRHDVEAVRGVGAQRVSLEFKRNEFLAFKEILTNIVKHAEADYVKIQVEQREGMLVTTVEDNGKGFDVAAGGRGRGNGLVSLHRRAASIGGVCEVTSLPSGGTKVRFSGKL